MIPIPTSVVLDIGTFRSGHSHNTAPSWTHLCWYTKQNLFFCYLKSTFFDNRYPFQSRIQAHLNSPLKSTGTPAGLTRTKLPLTLTILVCRQEDQSFKGVIVTKLQRLSDNSPNSSNAPQPEHNASPHVCTQEVPDEYHFTFTHFQPITQRYKQRTA